MEVLEQPPFRLATRPRIPLEPLDADQVDEIHQAALSVLSGTGMRVLSPAARQRYAEAGCPVDGEVVRIEPALVESALATAPAPFTLQARNP